MVPKMNFIPDWKRKFPKLWSVRLSIMAAVASGIEAGFNMYLTGTAPVLVVCACVVSIGSAVARIVAQPKLKKNG